MRIVRLRSMDRSMITSLSGERGEAGARPNIFDINYPACEELAVRPSHTLKAPSTIEHQSWPEGSQQFCMIRHTPLDRK